MIGGHDKHKFLRDAQRGGHVERCPFFRYVANGADVVGQCGARPFRFPSGKSLRWLPYVFLKRGSSQHRFNPSWRFLMPSRRIPISRKR